MKDEIKEILNIIECWKNGDYVLAYSFNYDRASKQNDKILDYITNLQEERNDYKDRFNLMAKFRDKALVRELEYKSRNEKAIKLLKEAGCYEEDTKIFCSDIYQELPELLNILQGSDKDE